MNEDRELLMDRQIAPFRFTKDETREWASDRHVFVSSTMRDLDDDRRTVKQVIKAFGAEPRMFEDWVKDEVPRVAYLKEVRQCDLYLLLLGERYGTPDSTGFPPTRQEYAEAIRCGKPVLALQNHKMAAQREAELKQWIEELEAERIVNRYNTLIELKQKLNSGFTEFASERMIQWVKIDDMIFLAQSIEHHMGGDRASGEVILKAKIKDPRIISVLDLMSQHPRGTHRLTFGLDTMECQDVSVKKSSVAVGQIIYTIRCEIESRNYGMFSGQRHWVAQSGGYNQYSHRDMIEFSLKSILFNEHRKEFSDSFMDLPKGDLLSIYEDWKDEPQHFPMVARFYIIEKL